MELGYTTEKNVQMLIYLLKAHKIKYIIASPGTTNITFVASLQADPWFKIYSAPDERSAAYMACGIAAEKGEPVVLSCTGATASRNYLPALTEAFYRKLPVLAVTSRQHDGRVGQLCPQVIDRSVSPKDVYVEKVDIPTIYSEEDEWSCNVKLNTAILALKHRGGGPVHIDLTTQYDPDFSVQTLPMFRMINRICQNNAFPDIGVYKKIAIYVGNHAVWNKSLTNAVDEFCEKYNAFVAIDHTSNYKGKYGVYMCLVTSQYGSDLESKKVDLLIDLGNVSGAYMFLEPKAVWRINPDGLIKDAWKKLTVLFDMEEIDFFLYYNRCKNERTILSNYEIANEEYNLVMSRFPEVPFSNIWIAKQVTSKFPENTVLHLGILNSLRSWNFFKLPSSVDCYSNTGGFGIDGILSTLIGASLVNPQKLFYAVIGDLAFFYDLNSLANRNVGRNLRILLINNGCGTEFKNYSHFAARFGEDANPYIAAKGHYGAKSKQLIKHYAEDLGFLYLSASTKEEFLNKSESFFDNQNLEKSVIFEVFTRDDDESQALLSVNTIMQADSSENNNSIKKYARRILGDKITDSIKKVVKK